MPNLCISRLRYVPTVLRERERMPTISALDLPSIPQQGAPHPRPDRAETERAHFRPIEYAIAEVASLSEQFGRSAAKATTARYPTRANTLSGEVAYELGSEANSCAVSSCIRTQIV